MGLEKLVGQTLDGKYSIERELGKGGMGTVYLATHLGTERAVAVKVISPDFMRRTEFVERFKREAKAAGRLRHPNVVDVTDFGFAESKVGSVAYLVMEYLDGCTLGEILDEEKQLPLAWSLDILEQVASAVHEAHAQGIIHRDLKPDNIWLEPNPRGGYTVKVLDFGIAKLEEHIEENELAPLENKSKLASAVTVANTFADKRTLAINQNDGRFTEAENSSRTISANIRNNTVFTDFNNNQTLISEVSENQTLAFGTETGTRTIKTESATIITENENQTLINGADADDESGTKIFPAVETTARKTVVTTDDDDDDDSGATKIMTEISENAVSDNLSGAPTESGKKNSLNNLQSLMSDSSNASLTRAGAVLGTPLYMSPEQCRGEKLDSRADIYALGVIAYQLLAGKTPFSGTYTEVMKAHCDDEPPMLKAKKVPALVRKTIASAMAKEPAQRPPSAMIFASQLRAHADGTRNLLQRGLVIWSEHLPIFLGVTFFITLPTTILTICYVVLQFLIVSRVISSVIFEAILGVGFGLLMFFVGIIFHSIAIGITTWIVIQLLSVPLRPVSWRPAFSVARKNWKKWAITVSFSSLFASFGLIFGVFLGIGLYGYWIFRDFGAFLSMILKPQNPENQVRWLEFRETLTFRGFTKGITFFFIVFSGLFWSIRYSLVSPILMMEGISGRKALKRSAELVNRSYWTAATTILIYMLLPLMLTAVTVMVTNSMVKFDNAKSPPKVQSEENSTKTGDNDGGLKIKINGEEINPKSKDAKETKSPETLAEEKENRTAQRLGETLKATLFQIFWLPVSIILTSFSAVTLALLYLKTRQSGGESMKELLGKFEEERPQMKWQKRVRDRLEQSGRTSSKG